MPAPKDQQHGFASNGCVPTVGENQMLNIFRIGYPSQGATLENFRLYREHLESPIGRVLLDEMIQESNRRINRLKR